ncbi:uncharacterized protein LOC127830981 isoform X2 [Dreissena polymorpha]|uniref:Uncharacterized protein n=1 Tax=Dreissena polymorpha TaxID=45954 RepID=A0A9D4GUF8_DREPO|nr:uncharacterized protein LOC127830981 isoform X2 [Dreissena polymorpha]KAH3821760.1 hypothetical protein DPMN_123527 [Dreissena polymorpha]
MKITSIVLCIMVAGAIHHSEAWLFKDIKKAFTDAGNAIKGTAQNAGNAITGAANVVGDTVKTGTDAAKDAIVDGAKIVANIPIVKTVHKAGEGLVNDGVNAVGGVVKDGAGAVKDGVNKVISFFG